MAGRTPHKTHYVEWFLIDRFQGSRVAWGATHALLEGDVPKDTKEISFIIGPLLLPEGQYFLSFALGVPAVTNFDFWHEAITLEIIGSDPAGSGLHYTNRYAPIYIPYKIAVV
jgi:hypothetical protein